MDFHKNFWKCYSHNPKHPYQFSAKSMKSFYFYLYLKFFFQNFRFFITAYPFLKRKRVKICKCRLRRLKAYRQDLKMKKKSSQYLFSLQRYVCLKIGVGSSPNSVGDLLAQFSQKLFIVWSLNGTGSKTKYVSFAINTI